MAQHRAIAGPNEITRQGHRRHAAVACNCASLHFGDKHVPQRGAAQVHNESGPPSCAARAQGPGRDQVGPRRKPHTHIASV